MSLCPNGDRADAEGYLSLFLYVNNAEGTTFKVQYQLGLMNSNDQKIQYFHDVGKRDGLEFKSGLGYGTFVSHAELFDPSENYVADGKLTIACKVS